MGSGEGVVEGGGTPSPWGEVWGRAVFPIFRSHPAKSRPFPMHY